MITHIALLRYREVCSLTNLVCQNGMAEMCYRLFIYVLPLFHSMNSPAVYTTISRMRPGAVLRARSACFRSTSSLLLDGSASESSRLNPTLQSE